jgi:hypothetical protein
MQVVWHRRWQGLESRPAARKSEGMGWISRPFFSQSGNATEDGSLRILHIVPRLRLRLFEDALFGFQSATKPHRPTQKRVEHGSLKLAGCAIVNRSVTRTAATLTDLT